MYPQPSSTPRRPNIALIGNPNCGKTVLFNALTGSHQRVGNWPGVTVTRKTGMITLSTSQRCSVVDLPGIYSLTGEGSQAIDAQIARAAIMGSSPPDLLVNVIDGSHLVRSLYLTTQLLALGYPMVIVVNMMDVVDRQGLSIDFDQLSKQFQCPVLGIVAKRQHGLPALKTTMAEVLTARTTPVVPDLPLAAPLKSGLNALVSAIKESGATVMGAAVSATLPARFIALQLLDQDQSIAATQPTALQDTAQSLCDSIEASLGTATSVALASARYAFIQQVKQRCVHQRRGNRDRATTFLDKIVLNRWLGLPIFLLMMYLLFLLAIGVGCALQSFFDISTHAIFVDGVAVVLQRWQAPPWLIAMLAQGIGNGINTTLTFIPVIGMMFLCLSFLEDSGYMSRAAFVVDRVMRAIGLPGQAFVPMIVGFGCNVPAVMGARTLSHPRDRILTVMMTPFMSCGARLAIFAVFAAAFFPSGGQNIIFLLYLLGIAVAVLTGLLLRKTVLTGQESPMVMTLPRYHWPTMNALMRRTWFRLKGFVWRAGKVIVPVCILIGALNAVTLKGHWVKNSTNATNATNASNVSRVLTLSNSLSVSRASRVSSKPSNASGPSILASMGQWVTPVLAPMGIKQDNWPATVGLVTGVLAKEVVIGTLNSLYTQQANTLPNPATFHLWQQLHMALTSVPQNFAQFGHNFRNPFAANEAEHTLDHHVYGVMVKSFGSKAAAFAYLLFVLLYFPCISTLAVVRRELTRAWGTVSMAWSFFVAYAAAVFVYQGLTISDHMGSSLCDMGMIVISFVGVYALLRWLSTQPWCARALAVTYTAGGMGCARVKASASMTDKAGASITDRTSASMIDRSDTSMVDRASISMTDRVADDAGSYTTTDDVGSPTTDPRAITTNTGMMDCGGCRASKGCGVRRR